MTATQTTFRVAGLSTVLRYLYHGLRPQRIRLLVLLGVTIAASAFVLVTPRLLGRIVDAVDHHGDTSDLWQLVTVMVIAAFAAAVTAAAANIVASNIFETLLADLREAMMDSALGLPLPRVEQAGAGDLVSRATDDVAVVSEAISEGVPSLLNSAFTVVVTGAGLALLSPWFLLTFAAVVPVHVFALRMYLRNAPGVYAAERAAMAQRARFALQAIRGLDTVHAFDLSDSLGRRIAARSWQAVVWALRARILLTRMYGRINFGEFAGMITVLVVGFVLVGAHQVSVGETTAAMLFFLLLFTPIGDLLLVADDLQLGAAALGRIVGVMVESSATTTTPVTDQPAVGAAGSVEITDISFGYTPDHPVLHRVSLSIAPGEHVALVGGSGAGKSTLAGLVAGIYHPQQGSVRVNGVPIADLVAQGNPNYHVALLTQDVHVFAGPLRDDVRMAAPHATDIDLETALRDVGAWGWVSRLSAGLDTIVGRSGEQLTPAQAQQLALARILLLDPPIVVLDEATADAGSTGAAELERSVDAVLARRSALVIAHRLSQAATCDRIVVLEKGRIVEQGTQHGLVASGGRYSMLWQAWASRRQPI